MKPSIKHMFRVLIHSLMAATVVLGMTVPSMARAQVCLAAGIVGGTAVEGAMHEPTAREVARTTIPLRIMRGDAPYVGSSVPLTSCKGKKTVLLTAAHNLTMGDYQRIDEPVTIEIIKPDPLTRNVSLTEIYNRSNAIKVSRQIISDSYVRLARQFGQMGLRQSGQLSVSQKSQIIPLDIALLVLDELIYDIDVTKNAHKIPDWSQSVVGGDILVQGYGLTKYDDLTTVGRLNYAKMQFYDFGPNPQFVTPGVIFLASTGYGVSCPGDSGGSIRWSIRGKSYLIGVVSTNDGRCEKYTFGPDLRNQDVKDELVKLLARVGDECLSPFEP